MFIQYTLISLNIVLKARKLILNSTLEKYSIDKHIKTIWPTTLNMLIFQLEEKWMTVFLLCISLKEKLLFIFFIAIVYVTKPLISHAVTFMKYPFLR